MVGNTSSANEKFVALSDKSMYIWLFGGILILAPLSALMLLSDAGRNAWFPITLHGFFLWHIASYGYLAAIPTAYAASLIALWRVRYFGEIMITLVIAIGTLTAIWFGAGWELSIRYQGPSYAQGVLLANVVMLTGVFALSVIGMKRKSKNLKASAHFVVFAHLAWCGFPWLGDFDF